VGKFGPCPECGQVISRDLGRCPYCRTDLAPGAVQELPEGTEPAHRPWEPRRLRFEEARAPVVPPVEPSPAPAPPAPPAPPTRPGAYRPTRSLGLALQLMFLAWMGLGGLLAAARIVEWRFVDRLVSNPFAVSYEQAVAADDRAFRLGLVVTAGYVVTGILFIIWLRRSYRNLLAFGAPSTRFRDGWAIGAWFVPVLNLFRPKQIVDEAWRRSGPGPADAFYAPGGRVPAVLNLWWGLMIAGRMFGSWFWLGSPDQPESLRFLALWLSIGAVVEIAAAAAAFWVVTLLTRRQAGRAAALLLDTGPRPVRRLAAAAVALTLPLAAAGATVPAFMVWDQPEAFAAVEGARDGGIRRYDSYGVSFDYPAEFVAGEASGLGTAAPTTDFGVVALAEPGEDDGLFVQWIPSWGAGTSADMVDLSIDSLLSSFEGVPLVHSSPLVEVPFGGNTFTYRTFDVTADEEKVVGAVGFGPCPQSERLIGVYSILLAGEPEVGARQITDLLATLSC